MHIRVPNFDELSLTKIMPQVRKLPYMMEYLPDFTDEKKAPPKQYVYNVILIA